MAERTITGAVALGGRIYKAGDEDDLFTAFGGQAPGKHLTSGDAPILAGSWGAKAEPEADKPKARK